MLEVIMATLGAGLLGVIAWANNLGNRVAVLEADKVSLRELINVRLGEITSRLERIEHKLDKEDK